VSIGPIQLLVPDMPDSSALLPYLREIDKGAWYTNFGPLSKQFEKRVAHVLGVSVESVCLAANCTLALEAALSCFDLRPGARVLVPAITFVATATAVLRSGFVPVLSDVDSRSWIMTPEIARRCTARGEIDCVIPVAAFGCPVDIASWDAFSEETDIPVLVDAAGAFGNQGIGRHSVVAFSFHATKTLGSGEGGLVASENREWIARFREFINFGIEGRTGLVRQIGTNAKLSEYHAAVGLASMAAWPDKKQKRRSVHSLYREKLARFCPTVRLQERPDDGIYSIMQVRLPDSVKAKEIANQMAQKGIETRHWYLPTLANHPAIRGAQCYEEATVASVLADSLIGIPFHLRLSDEAIEFVCDSLSLALARRA
jgi:dTDP-4-amino-4,6-dideoxygalactose transaminase